MTPEIHAVILWSNALPQRDRIVEDLSRHVELVASYRVEWPPERFAENLRRLYGLDLPKGVDKVAESGAGAFLLLVVRDAAPRYDARSRSWGIGPANATMHDAKQRYRDWTGGGFRVHTTIDPGETERDLFLLLGRLPADFADAPTLPWNLDPLPWPRELVGAEGWESVDQMLTALEVTRGYVQLEERPALRLLVGHKARTEQVIGGSSPLGLELHEPGDGDLDPDWQRALLRERIRDARGRWVPTPHHRVMTALYRAVAHTPELPRRLELDLDDEAAASLPPGDLADPAFARALVDDFLQENDFAYTVPKNPRVALNPELLGRRARLERAASARVPRLLRLAKRIERRFRG